MPALFAEWTNTALRLGLVTLAVLAAGVIAGLMIYVRTPYNTGERRALAQPVEFDHRHHARDDGIHCLYCHDSAEDSAQAGIPTAEVCMGCHNQIWSDSPLLDPVRRSYFSGEPIRWRRVHALGDFVYFDHSVHVRGGIACQSCHGPVEHMARVYQHAPLSMQWCLDCHRSQPGPALSSLTTCSACHR